MGANQKERVGPRASRDGCSTPRARTRIELGKPTDVTAAYGLAAGEPIAAAQTIGGGRVLGFADRIYAFFIRIGCGDVPDGRRHRQPPTTVDLFELDSVVTYVTESVGAASVAARGPRSPGLIRATGSPTDAGICLAAFPVG